MKTKTKPDTATEATPVVVRADLLTAISKWTYKSDELRPHLGVVLFEQNYAVATDGHRLCRIPIEANAQRFAIDHDHIAAAVGALREVDRRKDATIEIVPGDTTLTMRLGRSRISMTVPAGLLEYPPYERLLVTEPEAPNLPAFWVDPSFLADIDEVNKAINGWAQRGVRVVAWTSNALGPVTIEGAKSEDGRSALYVIMPMKVD